MPWHPNAATTPSSGRLNIILSGRGGTGRFAGVRRLAWVLDVSPKFKNKEMNLAGFGRLPVLDDGRVKPMDSLARNSARSMSGSFYERVKDERRQADRRPWSGCWIRSRLPKAKEYKLFKIESPEVVEDAWHGPAARRLVLFASMKSAAGRWRCCSDWKSPRGLRSPAARNSRIASTAHS